MNGLLVICGPTATGKTDVGVHLSKKFNGEIISADSRQVYKGMDIITGKDLPEDVPVWLVDIAEPSYVFNVGEYREAAREVIKDIWNRNKLPIIVGGTGLYIKSLIEPLSYLSIAPNNSLRVKLNKLSREELADYLQKIDPEKWNKMNRSDRLNPRRLIRAIEIAIQISKPKSQNYNSHLKFGKLLMVGLRADYKNLYQRIDQRVEERVKKGAKHEIEKLLNKGFDFDNSALGKTIGYSEWKEYFEKKISKDEVITRWKFAEHDYARRQLTWFNKEKRINWFDVSRTDHFSRIEDKVRVWYTLG